MIIKKKKREKGCFFQGDNEIVQRSDLSNGAKGLMCYFLSLPETWAMAIVVRGWTELDHALKSAGYVNDGPLFEMVYNEQHDHSATEGENNNAYAR